MSKNKAQTRKPSHYKYKFSFVMPVYNVEPYLDEAVQSILNQTMDFESSCQIIFVNDGSTDKSEDICLKYQQAYPKNIKYIKQENQGLSAARNRGLEEVEGQYVSFLDSDDLLSSDTLESVYSFLRKHDSEVDFACIKVVNFEAYTGEHGLSYKFTKTRIIDIQKDYGDIQFSAASSFFKASIFEKGHRFDGRIKRFAEDFKFMTQLLLDNSKYGVINGPVYHYRRRASKSSIMDSERTSKDWYDKIPQLVHEELIDYSLKKAGKITKYVQFAIMTDIQRRFQQKEQSVLSDKEVVKYKKTLYDLLKYIDDDIILSQRYLTPEYKYFLLGKKYKESILDKVKRHDDGSYRYKKLVVYGPDWRLPRVFLNGIAVEGNKMYLTGRHEFMFENMTLSFKVDSDYLPVKTVTNKDETISFLGDVIYENNAFEIELPLKVSSGENHISVAPYLVEEDKYKRLPLIVNHTLGLTGQAWRYRVVNGWIVLLRGSVLNIQKKSMYRVLVRKAKYVKNHPKVNKLRTRIKSRASKK